MSAEIGNRKSEVRWKELLELVKAAPEPDFRIDEMILSLLGFEERGGRWYLNDLLTQVDPFTTSVDYTLVLIEQQMPGWRKQFFERITDGKSQWIARLISPHSNCFATDEHPLNNPALALLAAWLMAKIAMMEKEGMKL